MTVNKRITIKTMHIVALILVLFCLQLKAQDKHTSFFAEKGFKIGLCAFSVMLPEGNNYRPLLLMGNLGHELTKKEKKGKWWIMFEPQFNPVFLDDKLKEAEFGINLAFRYKYQLTEGFYIYSQLGSGPHFITIATTRQAHGFIFSDNLALGISKFINNSLMLNTEIRIRHISNANFMKPNRGMNNIFLAIGITKKLGK
ncbi:MAG: acyloxyacyl hydrolase [Bacteroidetes bacterium]|nr:acyloxyacyl hydrolase [Bacteroidota bacterium]